MKSMQRRFDIVDTIKIIGAGSALVVDADRGDADVEPTTTN
jgi:hypothetical protein